MTAGRKAGARSWVAALGVILLAAAAIAGGLLVFGGGGRGPLPSVADVDGGPVRVAGSGGDRVYLMTSQWRTFSPGRRSRVQGGLIVDVWAFEAADAKPVWRTRLVDERGGVNSGRKVLGAQAGVLWVVDGRGLAGLRLADGARAYDTAAIEAATPALKGLIPTEERFYGFDRGGVTFVSADGKAWRLTGDGARAAPAGAEPAQAAHGVTAPARVAGGSGTGAFRTRGVVIGRRWLGLLHPEEVPWMLAGGRAGEPPGASPRMRLWSARIVEEQTFFGPRGRHANLAPLPESPEFLEPSLLNDSGANERPIFASGPDSVFVLHRDRLGDAGRLRLSRVAGPAGRVLWTTDLPAQALEAVMPGERSIVLLGSREEEPIRRRQNERRKDSVDQLIAVDVATGRIGVYGCRVKPGKDGEIPVSSTKPP